MYTIYLFAVIGLAWALYRQYITTGKAYKRDTLIVGTTIGGAIGIVLAAIVGGIIYQTNPSIITDGRRLVTHDAPLAMSQGKYYTYKHNKYGNLVYYFYTIHEDGSMSSHHTGGLCVYFNKTKITPRYQKIRQIRTEGGMLNKWFIGPMIEEKEWYELWLPEEHMPAG